MCKAEHRVTSTLIDKIDQILEIYYVAMGRYDYNHKFKIFCKQNNINDGLIITLLIKNEHKKSIKLVNFDDNFPIFPASTIQGKNKGIAQILRYCAAYNPSITNKTLCSFKMSWNDIMNMMQYEKGEFIANLLRKIIKENSINQFDLSDGKLNEIINKFGNKQHLHQLSKTEIDNLRNIILKARLFIYFGEYPSFLIDDINDIGDIGQDIFDVHRALLFSQNRMENHLNDFHFETKCNINYYPRFNFQPYFVINDNMMEISHFVCGITLFVNALKCKYNEFKMELIIIPQLIESVFNEKWIFPIANSISYIDKYLLDQNCTNYNKICVSKSKTQSNVHNIQKIVKQLYLNQNEYRKNKILMIIDRRSTHQNILYFTSFDSTFNFDTLRRNYCFGMSFYTKNDGNYCYLHYGVNEKTRFYPEYLESIFPLLFKKNASNNIPAYPNTFAVNLNDPIFNAQYKQCTKHQHISLNYYKEPMTPTTYAYPCKDGFNLNVCQGIKYIVKVLNNTQVTQQSANIDLKKLICSYDHIIRKHALFKNKIQQQQILQHFNKNVGFCRQIKGCPIYTQHMNKCKCIQSQSQSESHTSINSVLYSLHSYLLHQNQDDNDVAIAIESIYPIVDFCGMQILEWRYYLEDKREAMYKSFEEEIINNKYSPINNVIYKNIYQECKIKAENVNINVECFNTEHLIAIKLYTDYDIYREMLQKSFSDETMRYEFYWWIITLYCAYLVNKNKTNINVIDIDWIAHHKHVNNNILIFANGDMADIDRKLHKTELNVGSKVAILLDELLIRKENITNANVNIFYKDIGFNIDENLLNNNEFINKIKESGKLFCMSELRGYRIIDRLVTELKIAKDSLIVSFPSDAAVNHLLSVLQARDRKIKDKESFYKKLGIKVGLKWLFKISTHCFLYQFSVYSHYRVVDRLIRELDFKQLAKHTKQQRSLLDARLQYTVFHALKYCIMSIALEGNDEILMNNLGESTFKMQFIYKNKDQEFEDEKKETNNVEIIEEFVKYGHEFVFYTDCKFKLFIKNEAVFKNTDWILYQSDTINLSDFCYNDLWQQFKFNRNLGTVTLLKNNIPSRYIDEILNAKYMLETNICEKSKMLSFNQDNEFKINLINYTNYDNVNYDFYARNELCLKKKKLGSFSKNCVISCDKILRREETLKFNELRISSELRIREWDFVENEGGIIRIYCHSTIVIQKDGSINAVSCGYTFGDEYHSYNDNDEFYGGTYATKGESYEGDERSKTAIYGEKRLKYLCYGSPSGYNLQSNVRGGGIIELIATKIINYGSINVGAILSGSGGSIKIKCKELINYGYILAKGGVKSFIFKIGSGGDGRIAIYYDTLFINKGTILPKAYIKKQKYKLIGEDINDCFTGINDDEYHKNRV